jgi:hypothetical protein
MTSRICATLPAGAAASIELNDRCNMRPLEQVAIASLEGNGLDLANTLVLVQLNFSFRFSTDCDSE